MVVELCAGSHAGGAVRLASTARVHLTGPLQAQLLLSPQCTLDLAEWCMLSVQAQRTLIAHRLDQLQTRHWPPGPLPQLQIITGKGNHSSEGEGSLGHAVNTFLQAHELTSNPRGGVVCVDLKRRA